MKNVFCIVFVFFFFFSVGCKEPIDELTSGEIIAQSIQKVIEAENISRISCFYESENYRSLIEEGDDFFIEGEIIKVNEDRFNLNYMKSFEVHGYTENGKTGNKIQIYFYY